MIGFYIFLALSIAMGAFAILSLVMISEIGFSAVLIAVFSFFISSILYNAGATTTPWILKDSKISKESSQVIEVKDGVNILYNSERVFKIRDYLAVSKIKRGEFDVYLQEFNYKQPLIFGSSEFTKLKIFDFEGNLLYDAANY
jgi:hypothetical protein